MRARRTLVGIAVGACAASLPATSASAAFPGTNGQIAFERTLPGGRSADRHIRDRPARVRSPPPLAVNRATTASTRPYSADGERIVFERSSSDAIWVMNADGSDQTQLTDTAAPESADPAFSPDGTQIVFEQFAGADPEIWVMNADGTGQVQLTDNTQIDIDPSFSPDGQKIVFSRTGGSLGRIFVMDADGENQGPLTVRSRERGHRARLLPRRLHDSVHP